MSTIRRIVYRLYWFFIAQLGIDLRKTFLSLRGMPRYIRDIFRFRLNYTGRFELRPCLHDWYEEGGTTRNEYFWQDLLVARKIFEEKPQRHVDIGSRVDGFVTHVASFREIEVFDIRSITTQIPGVIFKQADLMNSVKGMTGYCDSLSCLHALEHFGLGRYGDSIDPVGFKHGFVNMTSLLRNGGVFYLSVPIGIDRVEFNAHRVFDPRTIIHCAEFRGLQLQEFTVISAGGEVRQVQPDEDALQELAQSRYNLGIFIFIKI